MHVEMRWHSQDGERLPVALWCPGPGYRMISSGVAGGGIGPREWVLNAQVQEHLPPGLRPDRADHPHLTAHRVALAAAGGFVHGPSPDAQIGRASCRKACR